MRSGMTARGTQVVQKMATAQMLQTCRVERVTNPTYSTSTLVASPGSRTTIYPLSGQVGTCRIWEQENPSQIALGESDFMVYQTVLSLPWDTTAAIKLLDEVEILTSPTDSQWVGTRFRIQSLKRGGQIRATRSFVLENLGPRS